MKRGCIGGLNLRSIHRSCHYHRGQLWQVANPISEPENRLFPESQICLTLYLPKAIAI